MPHSFISNRVPIVFSTRERRALIAPDCRDKLRSYLVGIGKNLGVKIFSVGGTANHLHILLELPGTMSLLNLAAEA